MKFLCKHTITREFDFYVEAVDESTASEICRDALDKGLLRDGEDCDDQTVQVVCSSDKTGNLPRLTPTGFIHSSVYHAVVVPNPYPSSYRRAVSLPLGDNASPVVCIIPDDNRPEIPIGTRVIVRFTPGDQFAYI